MANQHEHDRHEHERHAPQGAPAPERAIGDPNDKPVERAPIVVTSEQLDAQRNGQPAPQPGQPPRFRRGYARGRVRVAYDDAGKFVVIVGEGDNERLVPGAYRYLISHGGEGTMPTVAVWVNEPDPSGAMPPTAPLDIPDAEVLDVERLKLTVHKQATALGFFRGVARRACMESFDRGRALADRPLNVEDKLGSVDNAMLVAFAEYHIARTSLGDAVALVDLALTEVEQLKQAGVHSGEDVDAVLGDTLKAMRALTEAAGWQAIELAHSQQRELEAMQAMAKMHEAAQDATPATTNGDAPREPAAIGGEEFDAAVRAQVDLRVAEIRDRMSIVAEHTGALDAARRAAVEEFAHWLCGAGGPQVMRAQTASQREQRAHDLVEAFVEQCDADRSEGSDANNPADEPGGAR